MREFTSDLIALYRVFALVERDQVCCGEVTIPQCVLLQDLLEGPREISELADRAGVSPPAMTRLVDGAEKKAWVSRTRDDVDRRRVHVGLTNDGKELAERLRAQTDLTAEAVLARVPKAKQKQCVEAVSLLREAVEALREALEGCCAPTLVGLPKKR